MANEKRLIDANSFSNGWMLAKFTEYNGRMRLIKTMQLQDVPTVDAVEVVQAKWILVDKEKGKGICSNCHRQDSIDPIATHCRFCGAKMDGDGNV